MKPLKPHMTPEEVADLLSPRRATPVVELPFKLVLGWFMASDPTPLSRSEDDELRTRLDDRARQLGFSGWVEAFHSL